MSNVDDDLLAGTRRHLTGEFSLLVTAQQRPEVPEAFGELQKWLQTAEAVLGPLQIALFAVALRMRLKR